MGTPCLSERMGRQAGRWVDLDVDVDDHDVFNITIFTALSESTGVPHVTPGHVTPIATISQMPVVPIEDRNVQTHLPPTPAM